MTGIDGGAEEPLAELTDSSISQLEFDVVILATPLADALDRQGKT